MLKQWQTLMKQANADFENKAYPSALEKNQQALTIARRDFEQMFIVQSDEAVASVLVSYFSLADIFLVSADFYQAYYCYQQSLQFIEDIMSDCRYDEKQKQALFRGLSKLQQEWGYFRQRHQKKLTELHQHQRSLIKFQLKLSNLLKANDIFIN